VRTLVLAALAACMAVGPAWGACSVHEETIDRVTFLTMENDLILVRVLPAMGGALSDFELKGHGPLLAPGRITREKVLPPIPIYREQPNGWGLTDWFYPGGGYSLDPWQAGVIENTTATCAIEVRHRMVSRTMRIREGSSAVEVAVTVTNTGDAPFGNSYRLHGMYQLGGEADVTAGAERLFVPIAATTQPRRTLAEVSLEPVLLAEAPRESWSRFLAPAQPWMALVDTAERLVAATVLAPEQFSDQVVFYSWAGEPDGTPLITQEMVPAPRSLAPGESATYQASLVAFSGLQRVDYVCAELALAVDLPDAAVAAGEVRVPVRLATSKATTVALELVLTSEAGELSGDPLTLSAEPWSPAVGEAVFADVPAGRYTITFRVRGGDGAVIAEDTVWAKGLVVRAG